MPRVAALLGVGQLSDIMAVESAYKFRRPIYAGNAIITVEAPQDRKVVATVRVASFQAAAARRQRCDRSRQRHAGTADAHALRHVAQLPQRVVPICKRRLASSRAAAPLAAPTTSRSSSASPTSWVRVSARRARRSMPATRRTICRSARPARSLRPNCMSPSASQARSSISPASRMRARSSPSTRIPKRRSSKWPISAWSAICSRCCRSWRRRWAELS